MRRALLFLFSVALCAQQPVSQGPQAGNASEWKFNMTQVAGGVLGSMANYGTSPGAVLVPGVNAFVTNTPAVTQSAGPWTFNITQVAGGVLGATSNYGTSPGAVAVMGVNAFITNTPPVSQSGTWTVRATGNTGASFDAATGAAPPANAIQEGVVMGDVTTGGHLKTPIYCDNKAVYDASTNGSTNIVAKVASQNIYVCGFEIFSAGTANVKLISGTLTTNPCDTSTVSHTPAFQLVAQTGIVDNHFYGNAFKVVTNTDLCLNTSAGVAVQAIVYWTQF